jgi:hypothetical protein
MGRNVVIHEFTGDPAGYAIASVERRFEVTRLCDGVVIGVYETRVTAIAAAEADRTQQDE